MKSTYGIKPIFASILFLLMSVQVLAKTMEEWAEEYGIRMDASYEATRIMETQHGRMSFKEHKAPQKTRMEMSMGGVSGTMILREDLGTSYFVMPEMGMYREMQLKDANSQAGNNMQVSKVEELGREEINGFQTRKFKTQFKNQDGKGSGFMWITDDGVAIKMDMEYQNRRMKGQRMIMELTDLKMRSQAASLFELPSNIKPMTLGAMMGTAQRSNRDNNDDAAQNPSLAEEVGEAAKDETRAGVVNETRKAVREGLRGLFKR